MCATAGRIYAIFKQYHPQVIFHAAAHKHVPLMEINVEEAVTNNVLGTRNMVECRLEEWRRAPGDDLHR